MYWLQGNKEELPQRTHFWNNRKFYKKDHRFLRENLMVCVQPDPEAVRRLMWGFIPIFHMPRFGGWRKYVVLCPNEHWCGGAWFVGWLLPNNKGGISMVPLQGPVKCLIGAEKVKFLAFDAKGRQLSLKETGRSNIGEGKFEDFPLL
jgi:hypothetical protein